MHDATSFTVGIHAGASPLHSTWARSYLAQQGLTSWREDAISYPGASLLEGASPNSWRCMLTGTDCAGKHNKPRAAKIHLHHRGQGPGSGMCEAPAADIFSCRGTKYIRLQTGTDRGPSTRLRFHPGGTGGPGTTARPFGTAGRAGGTQQGCRLRAITHPEGMVNLPTTLGVRASKPAFTTSPFLSLCLPAFARCLSPWSLSQAVRPHTPSCCPYTHYRVVAPSCSKSIARQGCTASPWVCPGASHKTLPSCQTLLTPVLLCQPWSSARSHCLTPRAWGSPKSLNHRIME